jgi:phenylalanyl-tRNA synthetase beta chain
MLLDVTGTNKALVDHALTLMTTALAERGARIRSVRVISPQGEERTPNLIPRIWKLRTRTVREVLGIELTGRQIAQLLKKMRYGVRSAKNEIIIVIAPAYRKDLLHEVDIVEDVAIAYGYDRLEPVVPFTPTIGRLREITTFTELIRDLMIGFGFQEIISFIMTSPQTLFGKMNLQAEEVVEVENPISVEYSVLRNRLLPGVLSFLSYNRHVTYPQRVFECGDVVIIDKETPTRCVNRRKLCGAISNHSVSYEDVQAVLYSFMENLGISGWSVERLDHPSFIQGRAATMCLHGNEIVVLGEINPTTLEQFGLENPIAAFEIDVEQLMSERVGRGGDNNL